MMQIKIDNHLVCLNDTEQMMLHNVLVNAVSPNHTVNYVVGLLLGLAPSDAELHVEAVSVMKDALGVVPNLYQLLSMASSAIEDDNEQNEEPYTKLRKNVHEIQERKVLVREPAQ